MTEKKIKVGTFGILTRNGIHLLGRRKLDDSSIPGAWCHPGGGVEFGETINSALEREFLEEVLMDVSACSDYLAVHEYLENGRHVVLIFKRVDGYGQPQPGDGFDKVDWFTLEQIKKLHEAGLTTPLTLPAAERFAAHRQSRESASSVKSADALTGGSPR